MVRVLRHPTLIKLIAIVVIGAFYGCEKHMAMPSSTSSPGANEVWIQNYAFNPSTISVPVNTTVKWTNKDAVAHTVTSSDGLFDSGNINSGGTYSYQFTSTGSYAYKCTIHPNMVGTVVVH